MIKYWIRFGFFIALTSVGATSTKFPSTSHCRYLLAGPPALSQWPQIEWSEFSEINDVSDQKTGVGTEATFVAKYKKQKSVFLKVSTVTVPFGHSLERSISDLENEAYWFGRLSRRGWAPKFYGTSRFHRENKVREDSDHYVLVTDYVEGHVITAYRIRKHFELPAHFAPTAESFAELKKFFAYMEHHQIYPHDIQMIVQADGSWRVVDLEWYFSRSKLTAFFAEKAKNYEANKKVILDYFEQHLVK